MKFSDALTNCIAFLEKSILKWVYPFDAISGLKMVLKVHYDRAPNNIIPYLIVGLFKIIF